MDPTLWSRLPPEILLSIIEFASSIYYLQETEADRDQVWEKWLSVVRGNRFLHMALIAQQWWFVDIHWYRLLSDPDEPHEQDEYDHEFFYSKNCQKQRNLTTVLEWNDSEGFLRNQLLSKDYGVSRAQHVSTLYLLFGISRMDLGIYAVPSHRVIRRNMELVLPLMKGLRHLTIQGPPSDTIFEAVTRLGKMQLKTLDVGSVFCDYNYRSFKEDPYLDVWDWTKIAKFKALTNLSVGQVTKEECTSLCFLIQNLLQLRTLRLGARRSDKQPSSRFPSPLQALLGSQKTTSDSEESSSNPNLLAILPSTLRELSIQDVFYIGKNGLQIPTAPSDLQFIPSRCSLETLVTEMDDFYSVRNLLSWLPNTMLKTFSFNPAVHSDKKETLSDLSDTVAVTSDIISSNQLTLQNAILSNAWKLPYGYADRFNNYWDGQFAITDVVLGTNGIYKDECNSPHGHLQSRNLKHTLFGCGEDTDRWGSSIQRLRIDPPWSSHEFDVEAEDLLTYSSLQQLRILILSCHNDLHEHDFTPGEHQTIADKLARKAPPALRYIRLCRYIYWLTPGGVRSLEHESKQGEVTNIAVQMDPITTESTEVCTKAQKDYRSWLTRDDEVFLDRLPDSCYRSDTQDIHQVHLNQHWLQLYNFLVVKRLNMVQAP